MESEQFIANGSERTGFQTTGSPAKGLDVEGTEIGVRGHSGSGPGVVGHNGEIKSEVRSNIPLAGVWGTSEITGVKGQGNGQGVYGAADVDDTNSDVANLDTTGVLGEGLSDSVGVTGLCFSTHDRNGSFGRAAGVLGVSNAISGNRNPNDLDPEPPLGAGVVGLSLMGGVGGGFSPQVPLPHPGDQPDGRGTGVWGVSFAGPGVHGQSVEGRGGVFESTNIAQLKLVPNPNPTGDLNPPLPILGEPGDLYVVHTGKAPSMYLCVLPSNKNDPKAFPAFWAPFVFGTLVAGG